MMKILLFGRVGQLGWELLRCLPSLGEVAAFDYPEVDFTHPEALRPLVERVNPHVVINATAYTLVDQAETEREKAFKINATAPGELAKICKDLNIPFIHYSTDYVFDGKNGPYTEEDTPNPLNVYGKSKLEGEQAILAVGGEGIILRTAWVYSTRRDSFVTKVLGWARAQRELRLVDDQISNPTWARALAEITAQMLAQTRQNPRQGLSGTGGVYHLAGSGYTSRMGWAEEILRLDPNREEQTVEKVVPAKTGDFPSPAERPLFSALDCSKFEKVFQLHLPPWRDALKLAMDVV